MEVYGTRSQHSPAPEGRGNAHGSALPSDIAASHHNSAEHGPAIEGFIAFIKQVAPPYKQFQPVAGTITGRDIHYEPIIERGRRRRHRLNAPGFPAIAPGEIQGQAFACIAQSELGQVLRILFIS